MSTRRKLVEPDVDTDEALIGEDVRRWPNAAGSGSSSPDFVRRSSISFKPKEPTLSSSVVVGRAKQTDDRFVPTAHKDGTRRTGRRHNYLQQNVEKQQNNRLSTTVPSDIRLHPRVISISGYTFECTMIHAPAILPPSCDLLQT